MGKYGRNGSTSDSYIWKAHADQWGTFQEMEIWAIHNGPTVNAWHDRWLDERTMLFDQAIVFPAHIHNWCVADLVDNNGDWNLPLLNMFLPHDIVKRIKVGSA